MTTGGALRAQPPRATHFHACRDLDHWTWSAAVAISGALRRSLERQARARLLLSGGTGPTPVLQALSRAPIDWHRIDIALVDERWLLPEDSDSNAHLVRHRLLQHHAAAAHFEPLTRAGRSIEEAVSAANLHARQSTDVVVLGMGLDGHTASLFPGMRNLEAALGSRNAYVQVDATGCPGAGAWTRRISLTPAGLAPIPTRLLLIRGEEKLAVYEAALAGEDPKAMPVRIAMADDGPGLQTYWCP